MLIFQPLTLFSSPSSPIFIENLIIALSNVEQRRAWIVLGRVTIQKFRDIMCEVGICDPSQAG